MAAPAVIAATKAAKEAVLHPKKTAKFIFIIFLIITVPMAAIIDYITPNFLLETSGDTSTDDISIEDTDVYDQIVEVYATYREGVYEKLYEKADEEGVTDEDTVTYSISAPDIKYAFAYYSITCLYGDTTELDTDGLLKFLYKITTYVTTSSKLSDDTMSYTFSAKADKKKLIIKEFSDDEEEQELFSMCVDNYADEVTLSLDSDSDSDSSIGSMAATLALTKVGYPYSQDTTLRMTTHYDCSSLVYRIYKSLGISLPTTAASQAEYLVEEGNEVSEDELEAGDLIFYSYTTNGRYLNISHVAIYVGDNMQVEAANEEKGVIYTTFRSSNIDLYCRPY